MKKDTLIVHAGREPIEQGGAVNPPIYQTSTVIFPTLNDYREASRRKSFYHDQGNDTVTDYSYGTTGTLTTFALQKALAALDGVDYALVVPSGLNAITCSLMAFLSNGDHVLMPDSVYGPTRRFCIKELKRLGIETTFYDPLIDGKIEELIQENTKVIFLESPGSLTFEIQDVAAITAVAKAKGITTIIDNSWATALNFNPFEHGVDISVAAVTKYLNGHSDVLMGVITTTEPFYKDIFRSFKNYGSPTGPQECYLVQRGLRTLAVRLKRHEENALALAKHLQSRKEVTRILHPAFEDCPGHEIWKRDFKGSTGLFTVVLDKVYSDEAIEAMIQRFELVNLGESWGGFESLILPIVPTFRKVATWSGDVTYLRFYCGLEDAEDIIADVDRGFEALVGNS